jgi:hypothetical protein
MEPDLERFDFTLSAGDETHGFLSGWATKTETPWALIVEEQTVPKNIVPDQEDENYGFRDLDDAWRASFSNFSGGEGQLRRDVSGGSGKRYWQSKNIDIGVEGEIRLQHALKLVKSSSGYEQRLTNAAAIPYRGSVVFSAEVSSSSTNHGQLILYTPELERWSTIGTSGAGVNLWPVTCLESDGEYIYVGYAGGGIYRYRYVPESNTWDVVNEPVCTTVMAKNVQAMCFCAGYLYFTDGEQLHYVSVLGSPGTTVDLQVAAVIRPTLSCYGLVAHNDNWVYWGLRSENETVLYRAQFDGTNKPFELFAKLPSGFVATALASYLGSLFVGGYYYSVHGDVGQGAVYLLTAGGAAILTRVGEDPNAVPVGTTLPDTYRSQILAIEGYDNYLYLLTPRDLYRWDLRESGLEHVAEVGAFASKGGIAYEYVSGYEPVPSANGLLPTNTIWVEGITPLIDPPIFPHTATSGLAAYVAAYWGVGSGYIIVEASDWSSKRYWNAETRTGIDDSTVYGDWSDGGTLSYKLGMFLGDSFEAGITTSNGSALTRITASAVNDTWSYWYRNKDYVWERAVTAQPGKMDYHTFHLMADAETGTAKVIVDGSERAAWTMPTTTVPTQFTPGAFYGFGNERCGQYYPLGQAWRCVVKWLYYDTVSYVPIYEEGYISSSTVFAVHAGAPWIAAVPATVTDRGLMTIDWSRYPGWFPIEDDALTADPAKVSYTGELWTSETTMKLPTVRKYATMLDVLHRPLQENQRIDVTAYIDDVPYGPLIILPDADDPNRSLTSVAMSGVSGSRIRMRYRLFAGWRQEESVVPYTVNAGLSTPALMGSSLRFSPRDKVYYQLYVDLRDERKDRTGLIDGRSEARAFLLDKAAENAVLTLRFAEEVHQVQVKGLQFVGNPPRENQVDFPDGHAIVKLRVIS